MGAGDEQVPHATFESVDAADEFGVVGHGGGGSNMQAQTQHMVRVPSRFDSYLEARFGLARDAHTITSHPTRRSSRCC